MSLVKSAPAPAANPRPNVVIVAFRLCAGGSTRRCYVDVRVAADYLTIHWVAVHASGDHAWIRLPGASAERRPMYFAMPPRWLDQLGARAFERAVIDAVRAARPDVLAGEGVA